MKRKSKPAPIANQFGPEHRDYVRHLMLSRRQPVNELELIACIAARERNFIIVPDNQVVKIAIHKISRNGVPIRQLNNHIKNFLPSYGGEFIDFIVGHPYLIVREGVPEKHRFILKILDKYLQDIDDHVSQ